MKETLEERQVKFEKPIQNLIGKRLTGIEYADIDSGQPYFDHGSFHDIALGIQFTFNDSSKVSFGWSENIWFYLSFEPAPFSNWLNLESENISQYNLNNNKNWSNLVNKKIISVKSYWNNISDLNNEILGVYPQDLLLRFEDESVVVISNFEFENEKFKLADNLCIFFNEEEARGAGALNMI